MASSIIELAKLILQNVSAYEQYFTTNSLARPTLEASGFPEPNLPGEVTAARNAALEACAELQAILKGPVGIVRGVTALSTHLIPLQAISAFNIAASVPLDGSEISYRELSQACGLEEPKLRSIIRYAITSHIFAERKPGYVSHNAASRALVESKELEAWSALISVEFWPAATRAVEAIQKWPDSQEGNESGFQLAHNIREHVFDDLSKDPGRLHRFATAMSIQKSPAAIASLVSAYPWADIKGRDTESGKVTVVDVGGSHGTASIALAQNFQNFVCIVQDLPGIVAKAPELPPELENRVSFAAHDFFTEQPLVADVYFFRHIFHDWPEKYCLKILRCLVPALRPGARILVNEFCLPEPGQVPKTQEQAIRSFDLLMLSIQNSRERDAADWRKLFETADSRFRFEGVRKLPGGMGLVEVLWHG